MSNLPLPTPPRADACHFESLRRLAGIGPLELKAVAWSFAYFFCVLCSYYIIRPLRDEMGVTVGTDGLERLFVIVFLRDARGGAGVRMARFALSPPPCCAASSTASSSSICMVFWVLLAGWPTEKLIAAAFFVWVSVFNLFVVSLFWIVMADLWSSAQAKRLYGFIAAGGSAGAFCGPLHHAKPRACRGSGQSAAGLRLLPRCGNGLHRSSARHVGRSAIASSRTARQVTASCRVPRVCCKSPYLFRSRSGCCSPI